MLRVLLPAPALALRTLLQVLGISPSPVALPLVNATEGPSNDTTAPAPATSGGYFAGQSSMAPSWVAVAAVAGVLLVAA